MLGLDRRCTGAQIRQAYRLLVKRHHPDLHPGSAGALQLAQRLNAAHAVLSDPGRRRQYDRDLAAAEAPAPRAFTGKIERNVRQDVLLPIGDFFRGVLLQVRVDDPASNATPELYELQVPPMTAPGARFRLPRASPHQGGFVQVRLRMAPGFRFQLRGSDLRCTLLINAALAASGGVTTVAGPTGTSLRVTVPRNVRRGEIVRIPGEGMPRSRGGRGDLLVRINYRVVACISRRP